MEPGRAVHRYIVLDRVGEGGMGVVYAAYDPSLDRRVALKFLRPRESDRGGVREGRLLREAQAMARLSHPNVAVAYEVGTFENQVFLAMELVDGVDLDAWLRAQPRSFWSILDVFRAAGGGLAAAHAAGIIHRDFKPENVLVDQRDRPRVTDFGLSRSSHDADEEGPEAAATHDVSPLSWPAHLSTPLTWTRGVLGTPTYMAPEQHLGGTVDARSDQFAFCVALYEALYGEHPFKGDAAERLENAMAGRVATAPAQSPVPRWCRQALLRGLSAAPGERFPSMEGLLAALTPRPVTRRCPILLAAVFGLILAGAGAYALASDRPAASVAPRCDEGAERLAGVWDPARKRELRETFLRSGARGAEVTWAGFSAIMDDRARAWAAMHDRACAATHAHRVESLASLDLTMECLERQRQEMKHLADRTLERPDATSLVRAVSAANMLSSASACVDAADLGAVPLAGHPAAGTKDPSIGRVTDSR